MQRVLANGWSRNILLTMIQSQAHRRRRENRENQTLNNGLAATPLRSSAPSHSAHLPHFHTGLRREG
jgi:hypothetical protein